MLSSEERHMLEHARRWAPYGGVRSSDVLVDYGMSKDEFYTAVRIISNEFGLTPDHTASRRLRPTRTSRGRTRSAPP
ncbi:DUF3263 domain-containing protein [Rhodococcoides fascians]|uniref:DUF3263 domain-containing protein n=2 Tax=Nocardiaceae TaxID=85025 RepID=UPI00353008B9